MADFAGIADVLGGQAVTGSLRTAEDLRRIVRQGLPWPALRALQDTLRMSGETAARVLSLPERTMARRKKQDRLTAEESDRIVRLARITAQAISVLGSRERAAQWLNSPNRALGGLAPLSLLDTDMGTRQVEEILGRIEYGIYS
jgi:putative toxin-antitoxin system antitoxin component (TIGR02293 family)